MGFRKWLKGATQIRFDDRTLGNLTKNAAVGAGTIVGGPLGLAIGGAGSALGQAALPGSNIGDILGAGAKGAGTTGLAQAGKGLVSNALSHGAPNLAGSVGGGDAASSVMPPPVPTNGIPLPSVPTLTSGGPQAIDPRGFFSKALDAGKGAVEWAGNHDKTSAALLNGVGDALDTSDTRLRQAQANALERQNAESDYDYNQRKARDLALEPLRQALYGKIASSFTANDVAPNPYVTGGR